MNSWMILVFLKLHFAEGRIVYKLDNGRASWENAFSACSLATPIINFTDMSVGLDNGTMAFGDGDEAWVGYVKDFTVFQYVGCMTYDVNNEARLSNYTDTGADPGRCYSACGDRGFVGLMKTKCFCFDTMPTVDVHRTTCTHTCTELNHEAACGGNSVVSLYKLAAGLAASGLTNHPVSTNNGNCVLYDTNSHAFYPTICTMSYLIGCQSCDSGAQVNIGRRTVNWLEMTKFCFSARLCPYTHSTAVASSGNDQLWTGLIRARTIYRGSRESSETQGAGYVRQENGIFNVYFELPSQANVKQFICQEDVIPTTTPVTTESRTNPATSNPTTTVKIAQASQTEQKTTNLLLLFIILPIVVAMIIIVLVVAIIVIIKRRRNVELLSKDLRGNSYAKFKSTRSSSGDIRLHSKGMGKRKSKYGSNTNLHRNNGNQKRPSTDGSNLQVQNVKKKRHSADSANIPNNADIYNVVDKDKRWKQTSNMAKEERDRNDGVSIQGNADIYSVVDKGNKWRKSDYFAKSERAGRENKGVDEANTASGSIYLENAYVLDDAFVNDVSPELCEMFYMGMIKD